MSPISGTFSFVKLALFHPQAREQLRTFPEEVRKELGKAILDLQKGHVLGMPLSRPMSSVALGVEELRIRDRAGIYRAFYYKKSARGVLILHAFAKKTQKTPQQDLTLGRKRLQEMLNEKS
jgi:phage-related protein